MFNRILSEKIKLTPAKAQRFLTLNTFKDQRSLRKNWVSDLANFIREDLFTSGQIGTAVFKNGSSDEEYLINGQHQCNAVIMANKSVTVLFEKYDCGTKMEDVSLLYSIYV